MDFSGDFKVYHAGCISQDKKVKGKVDARNQLETYAYSMRSTVDDKMKGKISEADKESVLAAVKEAIDWLDENPDAGGLCCGPLMFCCKEPFS